MSADDNGHRPGRKLRGPNRHGGLPGTVPETVAIALEHEPAEGQTPRVIASGRGFVAERILELAFAHGVRVRQDADLAQMLSAIDIDADIPPEAFAAVAEILAYVYRANGTAAAAPPPAGSEL